MRFWGVLDDDPGWPFSVGLLLLLIPGASFVYRRRLLRNGRGRAADGLVLMRQLFMTFCISIFAFGLVLGLLYRSEDAPSNPSTGLASGLLVAGALSALFGPRLERPLDCEDDRRLAASYRVRFFLRIACSEVAALFGFVAFFLTYAPWTYPVGAAITLAGFARAAPTAGHLRRDQEQLVQAGCSRSLVGALRAAAS